MGKLKQDPIPTAQLGKKVECTACDGLGYLWPSGQECPVCRGLRVVAMRSAMGDAVSLLIDQFTNPADAEMAAMHAIGKLIELDTGDEWLEGVLLNAVEVFKRNS